MTLLILTAISVDKYLALRLHLRYRELLTTQNVALMARSRDDTANIEIHITNVYLLPFLYHDTIKYDFDESNRDIS